MFFKCIELRPRSKVRKIKVLLPEEDSDEEDEDYDCGEQRNKDNKPLIKCEYEVCNLNFRFFQPLFFLSPPCCQFNQLPLSTG